MVIVSTIGNTKELVAPTSAPPLATTSASSPPDDERPNAVLVKFECHIPEILKTSILLGILLLWTPLLALKQV